MVTLRLLRKVKPPRRTIQISQLQERGTPIQTITNTLLTVEGRQVVFAMLKTPRGFDQPAFDIPGFSSLDGVRAARQQRKAQQQDQATAEVLHSNNDTGTTVGAPGSAVLLLATVRGCA